MSTPHKTQLTITQWVCETNCLAVLTLFLLSILAAVFSLQSSTLNAIDLKLVANATSTRTSSTLHIGAIFVGAIFVQLVGHAVTACYAHRIEKKILENDKLDYRAITLMLSFPLIHAAVLVGVAQVVDAWACFASFLITLLMLLVMFIFEKGGKRSEFVVYATTLLMLILYISFWILAWKSGENTKTRTAQLGGFTCGLVLLLLVYFTILKRTSARIRALEQKREDGVNVYEVCYAIQLQKEAVYVCISVGFFMVSVATWICFTSSENSTRNVVIAVLLSTLLELFLCIAISHRLKFVVFSKDQLSSMQERLVTELNFIAPRPDRIGFDSDNSDTEELDLHSTNLP